MFRQNTSEHKFLLENATLENSSGTSSKFCSPDHIMARGTENFCTIRNGNTEPADSFVGEKRTLQSIIKKLWALLLKLQVQQIRSGNRKKDIVNYGASGLLHSDVSSWNPKHQKICHESTFPYSKWWDEHKLYIVRTLWSAESIWNKGKAESVSKSDDKSTSKDDQGKKINIAELISSNFYGDTLSSEDF